VSQDQPEQYLECKGKLIINGETCSRLKDHAVIMHPLPRVDEIAVEVDDDPRAAYFRQAQNGLFVRMALLRLCLLGA
jgi:aspartate carbamoyltransferase catalytic subunit